MPRSALASSPVAAAVYAPCALPSSGPPDSAAVKGSLTDGTRPGAPEDPCALQRRESNRVTVSHCVQLTARMSLHTSGVVIPERGHGLQCGCHVPHGASAPGPTGEQRRLCLVLLPLQSCEAGCGEGRGTPPRDAQPRHALMQGKALSQLVSPRMRSARLPVHIPDCAPPASAREATTQ